MNAPAPKAIAVHKAIDDVIRRDRGRLLAGLISRLGDFQTAEDALQEAMISALGHWGRNGVPHSPTGWLMKVALNKGIDRIRSNSRESKKAEELEHVQSLVENIEDPEMIPDERLRLIFVCCHPALEEKSRVALTLRTVCNLTTREIASAFLDPETTMGQRITRAKTKIKAKGIGFSVPDQDQWADRLDTVLSTLYLIFTTGYVSEDTSQRDLCMEAIFLVRLLNELRPEDPEIVGAMALMLLTDARRVARLDEVGAIVPVENQDRSKWNATQISEGQEILGTALWRRRPGPFQIKAAIADCHLMEGGPDWPQISMLYQSLWQHEPTPVVALNWAVVLGEAGYPELSLQKLEALETELNDFQPWHAAKAHAYAKAGRNEEAIACYDMAIKMAPSDASRLFLEKKWSELKEMR